MLQVNPSERPDVDGLLQNPMIRTSSDDSCGDERSKEEQPALLDTIQLPLNLNVKNSWELSYAF